MRMTNEQIKAKYPETAERLIGERRVLRKLLTAITGSGYCFRINNGEDFETNYTYTVQVGIDACMATDEDHVVVYRVRPDDGTYDRIGKFWLVYGNSPAEVIADYSAKQAFESLMSRWFDEATQDEE
ncbi:hypothetical protein 10P302A_gene0005 [Pseudomonas phage 10P302A]|uniref:Uncharacterized protein n=1 Tax=Pseudomonas phage 10P302A TaxID=3038233 RepID=A0AAF0GJN7_9CAUD|nr:hypothetical protein 10P302A_gene0005 [Pseudomonas phage 10P302A]